MARVSFFIDGFNVYHSLNDPPTRGALPIYRRYLWLDYSRFLRKFVRKQDSLSKIIYFSAFAEWRPDAVKLHRLLIDAWRATGIEIVMGQFKDKERFCNNCHRFYVSHEEKQTDVNVAIHLLKEAYLDNYDTAIIVTNDTDLVPAIKMVRELFSKKRIGVLFPIGRVSSELIQVTNFQRRTKIKHLSKSQFPDSIFLPSGAELRRPDPWK